MKSTEKDLPKALHQDEEESEEEDSETPEERGTLFSAINL